jgi:formimidoylglutamate deiminase
LRADIVVLDADHPALIGRSGDAILDSWIFSGGNECVRDVFVGGRHLVKDRKHVHERAITQRYRETLARLQD